jgi:glycosyltransferase involved in cell wall biosynthesis
MPEDGDGKLPRVLVVHNWAATGRVSGMCRAVEFDTSLLRDAGVEVDAYTRSDDEIAGFGRLRWAALSVRPIASPADARAFRRSVRRFRPDVVHVHNTMPLISPWVIRTAKRMGLPVVQTVNDYSMVCMARTFFRDGRPCHDCRGRVAPWPAVLHACGRGGKLSGPVGSRVRSAAYGFGMVVHRSTWRMVDRYLAVGGTVARHLELAGIDPGRITVRGDAVVDPGDPTAPGGAGALYLGRLSPEKGARVLVDAWERSGLGARHRLRVAGEGPERAAIERAAERVPGIEVLGPVDHERVLELMVDSSFVVVPSLWDEPGCLAAREAMARGRPVLGTRLGILPDLVDETSGWLVEPTVDGLAAGLRAAFDSRLEQMGAAARRRFEEHSSPAASLRTLLGVYADVAGTRHRG